MRRYLLLLILFVFSVRGFAQVHTGQVFDSTYYNPGWANMDYTVPESPAFKILGTNPDNILHPVSIKKIAVSVGDYFVTSGPVIPKSLAVQFSPWLLANSNTSLNNYNKNKFLSRLSFSLGTSTQGNAYSVAEGLNITIFDNTDLRAMPEYLNALARLGRMENDFYGRAIATYQTEHPDKTPVEITDELNKDVGHSSDLFKTIKQIEQQLMISSGVADRDIVKFRDSVKQASWNKSIMQVGVAVLQSSQDSLVKNLQFSQVGIWTSAGFPLGPKGQILVGGKLGFVDSITWQTNVSLGARLYYGNNAFKAFFQGEYDNKDKTNSTTISAGCQFNISNGIWGQFALNIVVIGGKASWQPGFNIGLGTPEKKKS